MTKQDLLNVLSSMPNDAIIDIYDLNSFTHPSFTINTDQYFDYDNGVPIITIEIS